jgi:hypothetical protein
MERLMANNVIPLDPKKRIEASLRPADLSEAQAAVAVLAKALPIMPSIQDPPAFKAIMAERLASYPHDVLLAAVNQAINDFKQMPSIHEMIELCESLVEPRRAGLRAIQRAEDERRARELDAANRAERAAANRRWCVDLQARLGDVTLDDIERATGLQPCLWRAGMAVTWDQFADEDPRAAAKLCRQLAEIDRSEPPDQGAIVSALADAGLKAAQPSAETEARSLGAVLRTVLSKGWRLPDEEDPEVRRWLDEMEVALE